MAVKNQEPSQLHDPVNSRVTFVNADGTAYKTILTATAADNSKELQLYSIIATSDDTVSRDLRFAINNGSNDIEQGDISIAPSSGFGIATPPVQVMANRTLPALARVLKDIRGNWFCWLAAGESLRVRPLTAVTATRTIAVSVAGWNFTRS